MACGARVPDPLPVASASRQQRFAFTLWLARLPAAGGQERGNLSAGTAF